MEKLEYQVELVLGVDDIPQPETCEQGCCDQNDSIKKYSVFKTRHSLDNIRMTKFFEK